MTRSGFVGLAVIVAMVLAALLDGLSIFVYGYFQGREAMHYEARATAVAAGVRFLRGVGDVSISPGSSPRVR